MRRAGVAGQPGWRLVLNSEQREWAGSVGNRPIAYVRRTRSERPRAAEAPPSRTKKPQRKFQQGEVTSNIQASRECQKDRPAAMARRSKDIAAAEEVDPPPPGIAAPIPKEGGDARQAQHGQKAHQAEVEGTLLCQNPQPEGGVALPVRQPPDTVQMKRPKEEEKQRLIPRDFHSAPPNLRSTLPQRRCFCKNWTGKVRKKVENRPEPCYNIPLVRIILYQTLERGVL